MAKHKKLVIKSRLVDPSIVKSDMEHAKKIAQIQNNSIDLCQEENEKRASRIEKEICRLDKVGKNCWTEYQVLPLCILIIDNMPIEELRSRVITDLSELKNYVQGDLMTEDVDVYYKFESEINLNLNQIEENKKITNSDKEDLKSMYKKLRLDIQTLRSTITDYEYKWAIGTTIMSSIVICGTLSVIIFSVMGVLPVILAMIDQSNELIPPLNLLNWAFLGAAGSIASALISLRNINAVEVGDTYGKREMRRMILGIPLGLLAGILVFSMFLGKLLSGGTITPNVEMNDLNNAGLAIVWAVFAGMSFDRVFQSVQKTIDI